MFVVTISGRRSSVPSSRAYSIGSVHAGIANRKDFVPGRLVAGCVEIGAYNRDDAAHWPCFPDVDRVAGLVVGGVCDDGDRYESSDVLRPSGRVERVLDGLLFSDLWMLWRRSAGAALKRWD